MCGALSFRLERTVRFIMTQETKGFDWTAYTREYRARHPEKRDAWRYNSSRAFVDKYEREHPNALEEYRAKRAKGGDARG